MDKILELIRQRRKFEYKTLDGYKPSNLFMHALLTNEIEKEMYIIGKENKRRLLREAQGDPYLLKKLKKGEV